VKTPLGEISDLLVEKHSDKITKLYNQNILVKDIGERLGISRAAVSRIIYVLKEQGKIKDRGQKGLKNIINAAYDKIKKREGRNPYLLELQRETGVFDNVIKKNLDRPLTSGRTVGPLRGAGAIATKEMYKTKKVDKPRPQKIAGEAVSVNWPSSESKKEYVKQLEEIYKSPKAKRTNQILAKNFGISVNDVERINKVLIKERNLKYPEADTTAVSKQRYGDLKLSQGFPDISAPAKSGYQFHHMLPYAGYAKVKSGDVMLFNKYLNAKIGPENLELNRIAREIVELDLNSDPNALNKLDALNAESEKFYNKAKNRLPKELKGATGYIKYNPIFDENGQVLRLAEERIGIDPKLSLQKFTNNVSKNIKDFSIEEVKKFKKNVINEANSLVNKTKLLSKTDQIKICNFLSNGGLPGDCARAIKKDPEKAAQIISKVPANTKETAAVKDSAQKLIRLYRGEGFKSRSGPTIKEMAKTFDVSEAEAKKKLLSGQWFTSDPVAASSYTDKLGKTKYVDVTPKEFMDFKRYVDRVNKTKSLSGGERFAVGTGDKLSIVPRYKLDEFEKADRLKSQRNIFKDFDLEGGYMKRAEGVLSYDSVKGGFVDPADPTTIVNQDQIKAWAESNPEKVTAGTEAVEAATNKSVLANVGKAMARVGAPLPTAILDSYFIGQQVKEGKGTAEIASNPLNWLGLATMEPLSKAAGIAEGGAFNKALRLGLNPATIRGITRFAGLPGLAISTALTAYDQYQKYKDGEGFIFNLLNQKGTE